jgi:branched-chain amino acid transport system substrate-binding protein
MRRVRMIAFLLALAAIPSAAQAQTKTVTLGAALQLTGDMANLGRYVRDGYEIAVDRINEMGGIEIGGARYRLTLKLLDSQSNVNLGVQQYVALVSRDKVDFLLGPYSSNDTLDDSTVAEKYRVPMVEASGAARQIFSRGYKYVFGTSPPADDYFASTIEMMTKLDPRPKTVALVVADDAFDVAAADGVRRRAAKSGLTLVLDRRYSEHNVDFSALLSLIKSKAPDAILWGGHETEALNFLRQAKALDLNPAYMAALTVGVPSADFRRALGQDADYVFGMTPWLPSLPRDDKYFGDAQKFAALFHRRFGYEPDYHVASAVAAVETFAVALGQAGSTDREKVRDAIAKSDFASLYARIRFAADGQIDLPQIVVQVQRGALVPIYTDHFLNKPLYPVPFWSKRG